jgi:hypothetical protein
LLRTGYAVAHMDTAVPNSNHFASRGRYGAKQHA